jgi:hypothetical protein
VPEEEKRVKVPVAWAAGDKNSGPKRWSRGARTDDPAVRVVHAPLARGIGDGKAFFFMFGFRRASRTDQQMMKRELEQIDDDIEVLRQAGYTVVVDPQGTREDFCQAVSGQGEGAAGLAPAGIYWSAHGYADGSVDCCDGAVVRPEDVDSEKVSPALRLAIFVACYVGSRSRTWRKALGGKALVVGWGQPVTIDRAVEFLMPHPETSTDLDDLLRRWLLTDEPLPIESSADQDLPPSASSLGRIGNLAARMATVAQMLGARWAARDSHVLLEVPLDVDRRHLVEAFLIDATEPFCEGEILFGAEASVGELSEVVTSESLLRGAARPGYGRIAIVASATDMPKIVAQTFVPLLRATDQDLAAHVYQVAVKADALERSIFGGDR